jgi:hypothetical protein
MDFSIICKHFPLMENPAFFRTNYRTTPHSNVESPLPVPHCFDLIPPVPKYLQFRNIYYLLFPCTFFASDVSFTYKPNFTCSDYVPLAYQTKPWLCIKVSLLDLNTGLAALLVAKVYLDVWF